MQQISLKLLDLSGDLPTSTYDIIADGVRVGMCQLRHRPGRGEHLPEGFESHIYYEIDEEHQGLGYAKLALRELIIGARHVGLSEVILVVGEDNIPSQRVIEANQAELLASTLGDDGERYRKYRIDVRKDKKNRQASLRDA